MDDLANDDELEKWAGKRMADALYMVSNTKYKVDNSADGLC